MHSTLDEQKGAKHGVAKKEKQHIKGSGSNSMISPTVAAGKMHEK